MKTDVKHILSALVDADYTTARLTQLAHEQIGAFWNSLSPKDISELDGWLHDQQMRVRGRAQIAWTYVRAVFSSIRQAGGPFRTPSTRWGNRQ